MSSNAEKVVNAWKLGLPASSSNFFTDGKFLYSYQLRIGATDRAGNKVVFLYNTQGEKISATTSKHVGFALKVADKSVLPNSKEHLKLTSDI